MAPYARQILYSDVTAFTNVGDMKAPILRILPNEPYVFNTFPQRICQLASCASGKIFHLPRSYMH